MLYTFSYDCINQLTTLHDMGIFSIQSYDILYTVRGNLSKLQYHMRCPVKQTQKGIAYGLYSNEGFEQASHLRSQQRQENGYYRP